jgi:hypothetical protein
LFPEVPPVILPEIVVLLWPSLLIPSHRL